MPFVAPRRACRNLILRIDALQQQHRVILLPSAVSTLSISRIFAGICSIMHSFRPDLRAGIIYFSFIAFHSIPYCNPPREYFNHHFEEEKSPVLQSDTATRNKNHSTSHVPWNGFHFIVSIPFSVPFVLSHRGRKQLETKTQADPRVHTNEILAVPLIAFSTLLVLQKNSRSLLAPNPHAPTLIITPPSACATFG